MTDPGPGQALFHFVRHWSRRSAAAGTDSEQGRLVLVCEAVLALGPRAIPATVNAIAQELGIDQSGASRVIASARAAGYLVMTVSATDGRQREATLTPDGEAMVAQAHRWQEDVFARMTADWSDQRRRDFQHAMSDLVEHSHALDA